MGAKMKRITLEQIQQKNRTLTYLQLHDFIIRQIKAEQLKPLKSSGTNGKTPALYMEYWIIDIKNPPSQDHIKELTYQLSPAISNDYYLSHLSQYEQDRDWVLLLDSFLKNHRDRIQIPVSTNERSFEIWHREKFLQKEQGRKILKRCQIDPESLNIYETSEPMAYYVQSRETPQNILIIENKDTFYSMRRHLLEGHPQILDMKVGTLIYGAGKGILRSFRDFTFCVEPYMQNPENQIYYFGDLDYEGIGIYEKLRQLFEGFKEIRPFEQAYLAMLNKAGKIKRLPDTKERQNRNISTEFFAYFTPENVTAMSEVLEKDLYIPQEILTISDFEA